MLTNGISYAVYKTNEPVGMEEKLLFEVDLREGASTEVADSLELIGHDSLASGALENWGDRVFTDKRVRAVLISLAGKPPAELIAVLEKPLGKPAVPPERLRESLARILDVGHGASLPVAEPSERLKKPLSPPGPKKEFPLDHHLSDKPAAMVDLFEQVDEFGRSLGPDVSRRVRKFYVGYYAGKRSFFTLQVQRQRLIVYLNLDPTPA